MAGFLSDSTSNMDDLGKDSITFETIPNTRQRETSPLSTWLQLLKAPGTQSAIVQLFLEGLL